MTHLERLQELAKLGEHLLSVPNSVNMGSWTGYAPCGTVHCLGGWAAVHPPFVEEGLSLLAGTPAYGESEAFTALEEFFGLEEYEGEGIFGTMYANNDGDVVDNTLVQALQQLTDAISCREVIFA